ncbi:RHS repeat-associated core domain-containing protein [Streptomyces sp. NPDC088725]|uniref:RHS repeat-associated core domain-containing protein n=1 Tax=Streptomyces sp. NPDC088725 TaxID=3365873 RepID=UPI00382AAFD5
MTVASETTATSTTSAEPDGTFTETLSPLPVRVERADGSWADVDATLVKAADGSYTPKMTPSKLALSGGGSGPLALLDEGGRTVSVSWPTSLPAPVVSGATATYANVLPDVDLVVTANGQGGFSEVLVIKSAQAAANPALATLTLATRTSGVSLTADGAGNLSATDASGTVVFHAPAPVMWDTPTASAQRGKANASKRTSPPADSPGDGSQPASGATTAPVKATVGSDGSVQLTPDAEMLASSATRFPVYVDPSWQPVTESSPSFTYVQQAYPNTSHWNESGAQLGVGFQGWSSPTGIERAFYQFNVKNVLHTDIHSATLNASEVYSSNNACTKYQVDVQNADHISSATTWNAQPALFSQTASAQVGGANGAGCDGPVAFTTDVTPAVATDGDGTLTLRVAGHSETDRLQFKRMSTDPTLTINYAPTPHEQGNIPWEQYGSVRLDDSLVASANMSTGDLVLNATDLDLNAVGQSLQLTRSASSFPMPTGSLGSQWFAGYDRTLDTAASSKVTAYGPGGEALVFNQNSDGTYKNAAGYHAKLVKNSDGTYTLTHTQSGKKDTYNASGNLTAVTDRNGDKITVTQTLTSGAVGGFKATDSRSGRWLSLTRGADAQHYTATDNSGRTVTYATSGTTSAGTAKMTVTDVTGGTTVYAYDTSGRISQVTTPEARVTKFGYDSQDRLTSMQRVAPTGTDTWTYAYSAATRATAGTTTVTDPNGHKTVYTVDGSGQVTKVVDALNHTRSASYDANHNQMTAVNALGAGAENTTTFGWDAGDNLTSAKLPTGATTALGAYSTHSGASLPSSLTNPSGKKTSYTYDTSGNLMSSQDTSTGVSDGAKLSYGYQGDDGVADCGGFNGQRCTSTDANNNKTTYSYDAQGNLTKTTPPSPLGATSYTYDNLGRPATVTDGRGVTTTYTYDTHDRVTKVATSGGSGNLTVGYTYDHDGNLRTQTDASGTLTYTYDALGREATRTLANGATYTQGYDPAGNLKTLTDHSGTTTYGYDDANELTSLKDPTGASTTFTYDNDGNRTATKLPGGTTQTATWDSSGRPTQMKATNPTGTLVTYNYAYKLADGTDTDQIQTRTDPGAGKTISYTYDSQSRLSYAQENAGSTRNASWLYCYDKAGNVTATSGSASACSATSGLTTYSYNTANEITGMNGNTTGWSYDKNGNELSAAGQLPRTGETYNDFNQLTAITTGGTTSHYTYAGTDSSNRLTADETRIDQGPEGISSTTTDGQNTGFVRDPAGTLIGMTSGGNPYYYVTNNQGAPSVLVDNTGVKQNRWDYGPTGNARPETTTPVAEPFGYAGAYLDPSGLYKMGARYYDQTLGRFTQPDPSGRETNPYLYAAADPINHIDPEGLLSYGTLSGIGDAASLLKDTLTGDTQSANATKMGILTGAGIEALCLAGAAAGAPATLGVSVGAGLTGCSVVAGTLAGGVTAAANP